MVAPESFHDRSCSKESPETVLSTSTISDSDLINCRDHMKAQLRPLHVVGIEQLKAESWLAHPPSCQSSTILAILVFECHCFLLVGWLHLSAPRCWASDTCGAVTILKRPFVFEKKPVIFWTIFNGFFVHSVKLVPAVSLIYHIQIPWPSRVWNIDPGSGSFYGAH